MEYCNQDRRIMEVILFIIILLTCGLWVEVIVMLKVKEKYSKT
jgi:hypothetical protein